MIYKNTPEIVEIHLGSNTVIQMIYNGNDLVFGDEGFLDEYIVFKDPNVKSIIVNAYGDPTIGEITYRQAAAVTDFFSGSDSSNPFYNNSTVTSFDEFRYFTGVKSIGDYTFFCCSGLTSITLPPLLTSIGRSALKTCNSLTSITIPNSVTSIGNYAFQYCSGLTSVNIPNYVTNIGKGTFQYCSGLTSANVGSSVTSIGESAFEYCSGLKSVTFGNSVVTIGDYAFRGCDITGSLVIGDTVTSIGEMAFSSCHSITSLTIGASLNHIGRAAFGYCDGITSIVVSENNTTLDSRNNCNAIIATSSNILGLGCKNTVIPSSVTVIYDNAFLGSGITSITIPSSVTSIGMNAFHSCGFTTVTIPASVTSIGGMAFAYCESLTSLTIPASVTLIGNSVLYQCTALEGITINATTPPTINVDTFDNTNNCPIYVPSASVSAYKESWPPYASRIQAMPNYISFADPDVKSIIVSKYGSNGEITDEQAAAVTTFVSGSDNASNPFFKNESVDSFDEFQYFTGISAIGNYTFKGCSNMTSIIIPENVTSIGNNVFYGCSNITSITIPASVTSIGSSAFRSCSSLTSVNIPNGITSISDYTFYICRSLTSITIPNGVTSIGSSAFAQCSKLTSLTIPASVTSIGSSAFINSTKLTSITCEATTPPTLTPTSSGTYITFNGTNNCPIYVPSASVDTYKAATGWSNYASRIQAIPPKNIVFADPDVKSIIVSKYGSNGEITDAQAAAVTTFMSGSNNASNPYYKNESVDSFDEFQYFTGISSVGINTFNGCSNMKSIIIPENVTSIGKNAFDGCSGLTSITIPQTVNEINDGAFSSCKSLTSITIPNGITSISKDTFSNCESLTSITIPNGVTSIGTTAFTSCEKLTSLTIPASVTSIGADAFAYCSGLISITFLATTPPTLVAGSSGTYNTFKYTNSCHLYVPAASVAAYKAATGWSNYASRIQAIPA